MKKYFLAIILFCLVAFGLLHQKVCCGEWFNVSQFWHHEPLIVAVFTLGVGILIGIHLGRVK